MDAIKIALVVVIVFAIGVLALPSTVSLFAGEHTWYSRNEIDCLKCHADIFDELKVSAHHSTVDGEAGWSGKECLSCHQVEFGNGTQFKKGAHAATIVPCGYCHFNSSNAPVAGGFGLSDLAGDTGELASHRSFVLKSRDVHLMSNESESCVACHTPVNVSILFNVSVEATIVAENRIVAENVSGWDMEIYPSGFENRMEVK